MKGGIGGFLAFKVIGFLGFLIVVGAVLIATIGGPATGTLYTTGAVVGGQSTGITIGSIPLFFSNIKSGQSLVQKAGTAPVQSGGVTATPKCPTGQKINSKTGACV